MSKEHCNLLVFGYGLGLIATVFGIGGLLKHGVHWAPVVLLACAVIFIVTTAMNWQALKPGYDGWMQVAHWIGMVVTMLILGVVFFVVFTPVALVLKLFGKDHLERKIDRGAASYWHQRLEDVRLKERYRQQF